MVDRELNMRHLYPKVMQKQLWQCDTIFLKFNRTSMIINIFAGLLGYSSSCERDQSYPIKGCENFNLENNFASKI